MKLIALGWIALVSGDVVNHAYPAEVAQGKDGKLILNAEVNSHCREKPNAHRLQVSLPKFYAQNINCGQCISIQVEGGSTAIANVVDFVELHHGSISLNPELAEVLNAKPKQNVSFSNGVACPDQPATYLYNAGRTPTAMTVMNPPSDFGYLAWRNGTEWVEMPHADGHMYNQVFVLPRNATTNLLMKDIAVGFFDRVRKLLMTSTVKPSAFGSQSDSEPKPATSTNPVSTSTSSNARVFLPAAALTLISFAFTL